MRPFIHYSQSEKMKKHGYLSSYCVTMCIEWARILLGRGAAISKEALNNDLDRLTQISFEKCKELWGLVYGNLHDFRSLPDVAEAQLNRMYRGEGVSLRLRFSRIEGTRGNLNASLFTELFHLIVGTEGRYYMIWWNCESRDPVFLGGHCIALDHVRNLVLDPNSGLYALPSLDPGNLEKVVTTCMHESGFRDQFNGLYLFEVQSTGL